LAATRRSARRCPTACLPPGNAGSNVLVRTLAVLTRSDQQYNQACSSNINNRVAWRRRRSVPHMRVTNVHTHPARLTPMPYIGIAFGTTNSVVANFQYGQADVVPNREGQKWPPSVVTLRRDGTLAFGQEAKENFDESRSIRSIKRILGSPERVPLVGQNLRAEQIAVMLFSLLKKDAEESLRESITKAVVTIPANSKGLARQATKVWAGAAGQP